MTYDQLYLLTCDKKALKELGRRRQPGKGNTTKMSLAEAERRGLIPKESLVEAIAKHEREQAEAKFKETVDRRRSAMTATADDDEDDRQ